MSDPSTDGGLASQAEETRAVRSATPDVRDTPDGVKKARVVRSSDTRAFANPVLERLSRVHPALPVCVWGPFAVGLTWLGHRLGIPAAQVAALLVAGALSWTLAEYALHRWLFHWEPEAEPLKDAVYPVHQLHHDVQEWDRLVAPPLLAVPVALFFLGLFWLLLGTPTLFPFGAGFTIGYLCYDYIHFWVHFGKRRGRVGRALRRHHLQHHYACEDRWYGVSSPLWDYVFRTHVPKGSKPVEL